MAAPVYQGGNTQDSAGAQSLTFDVSGASTDDFMVVFLHQSENTGAQLWDDDGGGGNGWTLEVQNRTTAGRDMECAIFWKFHDGSESDPTFTWNVGGVNEPMAGVMLFYSGVDQITPFQGPTYANSTNDGAPPNPEISVAAANTRVVCFHAATHDDISSVGAPTGFTIRDYVYGGSAGHSADHRDTFSADIEIDTVGAYTPPDWQHGVSNSTPEYQTYSMALNEVLPLHITDFNTDETFDWGDASLVIAGDGFGTSQGANGKVEFWSDAVGTIKSAATIVSWASDTEITVTPVRGSLPTNATVYLVVTNNSLEVSAPKTVLEGAPFWQVLVDLGFDIVHAFNGDFVDQAGGGYAANGQVDSASNSFKTQSGVPGGAEKCWGPDSSTGKIEMADTAFTNTVATHQAREIAGWIKLPSTPYKVAVCIWEEGGGVNNLYFSLGPGNALFFNVADSNASPVFKTQAYADFTLTPDRWYHILGRWEGGNGIGTVELWIDRIEQVVTAGDTAITDTTFSSHSGDYTYSGGDGSLDTGGTDITYAKSNGTVYSHWATASTIVSPGSGIFTDAERVAMFSKAAPATDTLALDTEANMQTAMDVIAPKAYSDVPCALEISRVTGGGDLEITLSDVTFDSKVSMPVRWLGRTGEELTIVNNGTSNFTADLAESPYGGTIAVVADVPLNVTVRDIDDNSLISGARVRMLAGATGPETEGVVLLSGVTNGSGVLTGTYRYAGAQSVAGRIRKGSASPYYKTAGISGAISDTGISLTIFMIKDE